MTSLSDHMAMKMRKECQSQRCLCHKCDRFTAFSIKLAFCHLDDHKTKFQITSEWAAIDSRCTTSVYMSVTAYSILCKKEIMQWSVPSLETGVMGLEDLLVSVQMALKTMFMLQFQVYPHHVVITHHLVQLILVIQLFWRS